MRLSPARFVVPGQADRLGRSLRGRDENQDQPGRRQCAIRNSPPDASRTSESAICAMTSDRPEADASRRCVWSRVPLEIARGRDRQGKAGPEPKTSVAKR